MSETYRIGDYEFHTYEEYLAAQEDARKIDYITKEVDLTDVAVAVRLYTLIRTKEIVFHSKIGLNFTWFLSDILAQNAKEMLEEEKERRQEAGKGKKLKIAGLACIGAAVLCLGYYAFTMYEDHLENLEYERLQSMQNMTGHVIRDSYVDGSGGEMEEAVDPAQATSDSKKAKQEQEKKKKIDPKDLTILKQYQKLYKKNGDLAGWLKIDGTNIDYPVMQTAGSKGDYYLHHDFEKQDSDSGCLFLDARNDFVNRDTNLIIYGHNMKNGSMFGGLKNYLDKSYWEAHKKLEFDTIYEKVHYSIVAVCLSKVNYEDDYTFRYYNFLNAESEEDFKAYLANIQQLTAFDQKIDLSYGDEILTLSTCSSYIQDGRLFLIAKKE